MSAEEDPPPARASFARREERQPFVAQMMIAGAGGEGLTPTLPAGRGSSAGGSADSHQSGFSSVSKTFLSDLRRLMQELERTNPHFVRCLKPNFALAPRKIDGELLMAQMASSVWSRPCTPSPLFHR